MFVIALLLGAFTLLYIWLKWNYSYWKRCKVPGPEPTFFLGNIGSTFSFSEHWGVVVANWYNNYPNEPYIGYYKMMRPSIVVRDPDLIKDILITEFDSFRANDFNLSRKYDPLLAQNPFFNIDDDWREGRKTIIPAFSQSKIKSLMPAMNDVGENFVKFIRSYSSDEDVNAKDLSLRFTTENVIKCSFSIEPGCFDKENESEFVAMGKAMFAPSFWIGLKFLLMPLIPNWAIDYIPVPFVPPEADRLFRNLVTTNKASRSSDQQRNDIFEMLLQLQTKHNFDEAFLAGHAMSLFGDGTETSSVVFSYILYELALNPHCQEKLLEEITANMAKHGGKLTMEGLQEMNYLEGVILEALRKHPALMAMMKVCTKPYTLPKTSGQSEAVTIQPGTVVAFPVLAIHRDPKYYPNPEEFIPERFSPEEQRNRHKGTFLGFGEGPRICLGMRFAIAQLKIGLAHVVRAMHIKISPNQKPIVIDPQTLLSYPKDGILVRFEVRN